MRQELVSQRQMSHHASATIEAEKGKKLGQKRTDTQNTHHIRVSLGIHAIVTGFAPSCFYFGLGAGHHMIYTILLKQLNP